MKPERKSSRPLIMWSRPDKEGMARNNADMAKNTVRSNGSGDEGSPSAVTHSKLWINAGESSPNSAVGRSSSPIELSANLPLSPSAQDRVFPIRSVVSLDPNPTPSVRSEGEDSSYIGQAYVDPREKQRSGSRRYSNGSIRSEGRPGASTPADTASHASRAHSRATSRGDSDIRRIPGDRATGSDVQAESASDMQSSTNKTRIYRQIKLPGERIDDDDDDRQSLQSTVASVKSGAVASVKSIPGEGEMLITARFKHVVTNDGHLIVSGRDGDILQRCEDEPIHVPGAVQGFGLLIAMKEDAEGKLIVRVASENSQRILGYLPQELFALDNFCDILSDEQADNLLDHLEFIKDSDTDPAQEGPEVFTISVKSPSTKRTHKMWCAMHINPVSPGLILCEFELENDPDFPLLPLDELPLDIPADTLRSNPTADELADSTHNLSKPLRVLRSARRKNGDAAAMEVFNIMSQVQEQLAAAPNLEAFLKVLVGVIKELTGFHRVMVYQFDSEWNGRVVTELVDPRATKDLYKGLNFPASDIPKQARDLYKLNKVRLLYDRDQETARLVCRTMEDLQTPVDMTYGYLRAMSPIHIKYLENMAVRSSMSVSINAFDELWGLIACHSYGSKGMRVSFPIRKMCRLIGDSASRNIERLSYASRLQARKLINTIPTAKNPSGYIIASSEDLLALFDADCGLVSIRDETKILGNLGPTQEALALLEYFRLRRPTSVVTSQDLRADFLDLRYEPGFKNIAGCLLVPLSATGVDFIVFFRRGQLREVKWAGNPYEKFIRQGTEGYLEPRKSFRQWSEMVVGKCKEWTEEQIETAAVLCLVYGKFIEVWRQKEAALHNTQLTRLLLANSAHEVRTPLNAIINYLEIAMESTLDAETRENLSKSHSASKSLIYVINDLLDLTKTEQGNNLIRDDVFDFPETIKEATEMFASDAHRKGLNYKVEVDAGIPQWLVGDQRRVRQAISNIVANAMQNTSTGSINVEAYLARRETDPIDHVDIDIVVEDSGTGMTSKKLDQLFMELEQVQSEEVEGLLDEAETPLEQKKIPESPSENKVVGLGLAVVSRIIRNMNGQLRLKSEEGAGSRFVMQLGFDVPAAGDTPKPMENSRPTSSTMSHATTPPAAAGEVTLVAKWTEQPGKMHSQVTRQTSRESMASLKSVNSLKSNASMHSFGTRSSGKSDVDRLIDAIQEPHMVINHSVTSPTKNERRSALKGSRPTSRSAATAPPKSLDEETIVALENSDVYKHVHPSGTVDVQDSSRALKAVKVPEDDIKAPAHPAIVSRVSFNLSSSHVQSALTSDRLNVLVAEDDPVNSKIITKRLQKLNHSVLCTINGEACASAYGDKHNFYDVVLMDMQVSYLFIFLIRINQSCLDADC